MPLNQIDASTFPEREKQQASISVVLPARNASATLPTAIASVLAQSIDDFELVLVDHSSTDDTLDLMQQYSRRDSRVKVDTCSGNFIEAVNHAWHIAEGELIARMDADDFSFPGRLESQRNFLSENQDIACCASLVRIQKRDGRTGEISEPDKGYAEYEKWINSVVSPEDILRERFVDSPIPNPATMIRREILDKFDGYQNPVWAEDYDLWLRMIQAGHQLGKVDQLLLTWYDGSSRTTRTNDRYSLENFQQAKAHFLAQLPRVKENGIAICGAGPIGKSMKRCLMIEGVKIHAFFEINERQIGNQIGGVPVRNSSETGELLGKCVLISAVGLRGAREKIRKVASKSGYIEGDDFFCVA